MLGIVGRKCGMTRVFTEEGDNIPVSVIRVEPNKIAQIKTDDNDGYTSIQLSYGQKKRSKVNKADAGHFAKAKVEPGYSLKEFRVDSNILSDDLSLGKELNVSLFKVGQKVDVTGISKGKGFQGVVKRHNFHMQDATHGNSVSHRAHGSTGQNQTPGRVFKNKKMAGHLGSVRKTIQSLEVVSIDVDNNLILIKGGVPGAKNEFICITPAVKHLDHNV
jgi:large subunit ribosomal protein L3